MVSRNAPLNARISLRKELDVLNRNTENPLNITGKKSAKKIKIFINAKTY